MSRTMSCPLGVHFTLRLFVRANELKTAKKTVDDKPDCFHRKSVHNTKKLRNFLSTKEEYPH
ncbi:hypothetical protein ACFLV6_01955 [Chloroflexota bacterium]